MEKKQARKKNLLIFTFAIILIGLVYFIYHFIIVGGKYITTDNAYAKADVAQITPKIAAPVKDVKIIDTQYVKKGDILVLLDDTDEKIALEKAKASLESTKREIRQLISNDTKYEQEIKLDESKIEASKINLEQTLTSLKKAKKDYLRYKHLIKTKSVSAQKFDDIKLTYDNAKNAWQEAKKNLDSTINEKEVTLASKNSNLQLIINKNVEENPSVLNAKANLKKAEIDLERTIIKAPISGVISQKNVKIGQYVTTNTNLLTIVPTNKIYVNANFKETKLKKVKIGQKVDVHADIYGDDVLYHGIVQGVSSATGSELSLIPAQNATGNWIKVVQRLPIRIKLDEKELKKYPLNVGLSMDVKIYLN